MFHNFFLSYPHTPPSVMHLLTHISTSKTFMIIIKRSHDILCLYSVWEKIYCCRFGVSLMFSLRALFTVSYFNTMTAQIFHFYISKFHINFICFFCFLCLTAHKRNRSKYSWRRAAGWITVLNDRLLSNEVICWPANSPEDQNAQHKKIFVKNTKLSKNKKLNDALNLIVNK